MIVKFMEATNGEGNWGKFALLRFDVEWFIPSEVGHHPSVSGRHPSLLRACGWDFPHLLVIDLQTGEGAIFRPGGNARADLNKHRIWVCPMFEPFLEWLYKQDLTDLDKLPALVDLPDAPFAFSGYRRTGPDEG